MVKVMRKLVVVGFVACLIAIDLLAASTLFFRELYIQKQSESEQLKTQIDNLQENKHSLLLEVNSLENNITGLQSKIVELKSLIEDFQMANELLTLDCETLNETYLSLTNDYELLETKYSDLQINYNNLNESYTQSKQDYSKLSNNYTTLEQDYTELSNEYVVLQGQYATLFNDYIALLEAFDEPLSYEEVPTTSELRGWLVADETDGIWYDYPNFICGDFAVMLSQHAKLEYWDMGVVGVFGYDESYEYYAHAFNAIITAEGLVYIEPQTDDVWWYIDHEEISEGIWWEFAEGGYVYVEDYVVILWYD